MNDEYLVYFSIHDGQLCKAGEYITPSCDLS